MYYPNRADERFAGELAKLLFAAPEVNDAPFDRFVAIIKRTTNCSPIIRCLAVTDGVSRRLTLAGTDLVDVVADYSGGEWGELVIGFPRGTDGAFHCLFTEPWSTRNGFEHLTALARGEFQAGLWYTPRIGLAMVPAA
jgi:hypothetical protein